MILKLRKFSAAKIFSAFTLKGLLSAALVLMGSDVWGQAFFDMSSGNYSQNFANIAGWSNNYASGTGAENWRVATSVATSTVNNATVFVTGTTGGVQKGTESIILLATGTNTAATDLLLNMTGRSSGTISLDWAKVTNTVNVSPRSSDLMIQISTDNGATFADLTGYTIPRVLNNNDAESGNLTNIALPASANNASQVVVRFYVWNNGQTGGSGNRPKIQLDNISITSTPATTPSLSFAPASVTGLNYETGQGPSASQSYTVSGTNLVGSGNIVVTAPNNFEVSTDNVSFSTTVNLPFASGEVTGQPATVHTRLASGLAINTYSGNITHVGGNASQNVAVSGSVTSPFGWQIASTNTRFVIDFDNTVSGVNEGTFNAGSPAGSASPTAGQLNSNAWAYSANTAGASTFGGNLPNGGGASTGGVTSGGIYAFEVATGNVALGVQPTGSVFQSAAGGNFTLRLQNKTGSTLNNAQLSYLLWVRNDGNRSTTIAFSHSSNNTTYTVVSDASYSTTVDSAGVTWIPQFISVSLSALNIANNGFLFLRWTGTDNGGAGSRDELAIDDISFIAEPSSTNLSTVGNFGYMHLDGNVTLSGTTTVTEILNIKSGLLNTAGNLTLKSTSATASANVVGGTDANLSGNVTVERFLPWTSANNNGFRFIGHPLRSNPAFSAVSNLPSATNTLIGYSNANNAYEGFNDRTQSWSQATAAGVWTDATNTVQFTGLLQLSDVGPVNLGTAHSGFNFVANPFAAVLDWDAVTKTQTDNATWVWVKDNLAEGSGAWASFINGVGANGGSRYLAPLQGFMVKSATAATAPSLTFPAAARVSGQAPSYQRTSQQADLVRVRVNRLSNQTGMETVLVFQDGATNQFDAAFDADFLTDWVQASPDLYTQDAQGVKYSINSMPALRFDPVVVPLQFESFEPTSFSFTFDLSGFHYNGSVQLEDTREGTFENITDGHEVNFSSHANDAIGRFKLHFNALPRTVSTQVNENKLESALVYTHEGSLYVKGFEGAAQLQLIDMQGRKVWQQSVEAGDQALTPAVAKGTYLVQLVHKSGVKHIKVIF